MSPHVSEIQLRGLAEDTLDGNERAEVERHLEECEPCLARLAAWGDDLVQAMSPGGAADAAAVSDFSPELLERIQNAVTDPKTTLPGETSTVTTNLKFVRTVGRGGLGQVYEYADVAFGRGVAVKILQDRWLADPRCVERFQREMWLTASIDHPGCPAVYGIGETSDGRQFICMQLISGPSLGQVIAEFHATTVGGRRRDNPQFRQLLDAFRAICSTISAAHGRGILHRDLKPGNVRVHRDGHPVVLDWGLAKRRETRDETSPGDSRERSESVAVPSRTVDVSLPDVALGTPAYMAPEQARGQNASVDERTDIYGLGAILHELLTGQPPHASLMHSQMDQSELLESVGQGHVPKLEGVPAELASICRQALAHDPQDRYATAKELADDIERWLAGDLVRSHRYGVVGRALLWTRRHTPTAVLAALTVFVLVIAALTVTWFQAVAAAERRSADERFGLALDAYITIVERVQDELVDVGRTGKVRESLLKHAMEGIERLVAQANRDPGGALVAIQGRLELARLERQERGDFTAARTRYAAAVNSLGELEQQAAADVRYYKLLCEALKGTALCDLDLVGISAARPYFDLLHARAGRFSKLYPLEPAAAMALAQSHVWQGRLAAADINRKLDAERHFQSAMEVLDKLPADKANQPNYVHQRLMALTELASLKASDLEWDDAIELQRQCVDSMTRLVQQAKSRFFREGLIMDRMNLGVYQKQAGKLKESFNSLNQALEEATRLAEEFPEHRSVQTLRQDVIHNLATVHRADGMFERAIELLRPHAISLSDIDPASQATSWFQDQAVNHAALARAYTDAGDARSAIGHYLEAVKLRQVVLDRDPANHMNLSELLVGLRKSSMLMRDVAGERQAELDTVARVCMVLDADSKADQWSAAHRNELAGVYYFLANAQLAEDRTDAARSSYQRTKKLLESLPEPPAGLLQKIEQILRQ
ncbi:MAG: protein kinase [Pirellulaceae bacterium]|nr:protein kinase [Pirellulaceae bacterium]